MLFSFLGAQQLWPFPASDFTFDNRELIKLRIPNFQGSFHLQITSKFKSHAMNYPFRAAARRSCAFLVIRNKLRTKKLNVGKYRTLLSFQFVFRANHRQKRDSGADERPTNYVHDHKIISCWLSVFFRWPFGVFIFNWSRKH